MPRLRTTTALSLLMLAAGTAGTIWLSASRLDTTRLDTSRLNTPRLNTPPVPARATPAATPAARMIPPASRRVAAGPSARRAPGLSRSERAQLAGAPAVIAASSPQLVPLQMSYDTSLPWDRLRGHLDGRVVAHVQVDGSGRVQAAWLVRTSGDHVLDDYALRSVRGWRFAVPAGAPGAFSGDLPMRFSSVAALPAASASQDALDAGTEGRHQSRDDPFR